MFADDSSEELILALLAEADDGYVHPDLLAGKLGLAHATVFREIEALRRKGYRIENSRTRGYRLAGVPDRLSALELSPLLQTRELGRAVVYEERLDSTQRLAHQLAEEGAPHGQVVIAEEQTQGRGRRGRAWISPPRRNLYLSLVLRPNLPPIRAPELTLVAAVALRETLADAGCPARIKWPNDVQIDGRKLAGILTELSATPSQIQHVILGIGVNLNLELSELSEELRSIATSVRAVRGSPVPRALFCAALLARLEEWLDRHEDEGFAPVLEACSLHSATLGTEVRVRFEGTELTGVAEALDETGALIVRRPDGGTERVIAGDVESLRPARQ